MGRTNALTNSQLLRAMLIVLVGFLASGIFGFVRVAIVSAQFGTSEARDAFITAQRLPELIFTLVAGGALGSSFIPVYARLREKNDQEAWQLASAVMTLSAVGALVLGGAIALFADNIVTGFLLVNSPSDLQALTANLMRVMMVTPFIFSISGLVMGILQSHGLFFLPSLAISMNSIGVIVGALVIAPALPPLEGVGQVGNNNVYGLALGAVLSAVLHLAVQVRGLWAVKARLRVLWAWRLEGVQTVLKLMFPRMLGLAIVQLNFVVNIVLASGMKEGSLASLDTAFVLMFFALGIIGQSIGSAVFPTLATLRAEQNFSEFSRRLLLAMRGVTFLALPSMVVFIQLGESVVALFERGQWTPESTQATAWALGFYALGMVGFALLEVLSRAFYALEDTWTPVLVGVVAIVANIILSVVFIRVIGDPQTLTNGAFGGLALANALTTNLEALVLWWLLSRRVGGLDFGSVWGAFAKMSIATVCMVAVGAVVLGALPVSGVAKAILGGAILGGVYFGVTMALRLEEATLIPLTLLRRFKRSR